MTRDLSPAAGQQQLLSSISTDALFIDQEFGRDRWPQEALQELATAAQALQLAFRIMDSLAQGRREEAVQRISRAYCVAYAPSEPATETAAGF